MCMGGNVTKWAITYLKINAINAPREVFKAARGRDGLVLTWSLSFPSFLTERGSLFWHQLIRGRGDVVMQQRSDYDEVYPELCRTCHKACLAVVESGCDQCVTTFRRQRIARMGGERGDSRWRKEHQGCVVYTVFKRDYCQRRVQSCRCVRGGNWSGAVSGQSGMDEGLMWPLMVISHL